MPELMRERERQEQLSAMLSVPPRMDPDDWEVYPVPEDLEEAVAKHEKTGHSETGTHRGETLSARDYRTYLWSLSRRELAIEQCCNAWSMLAKIRQIEHSVQFWGVCLSGLMAVCWAACRWQPRSR